ncbi:hypothetical protein BGY98DRAFT_980548 [Russula aff. rugulosa BPL654]|nr:hypothetical protein BGY98DRAFT_980548 [Russula aff. rugulosa BPL654]
MSGKQPIFIDANDPEYYAELLSKASRLANRRLPSDERPCPDVLGIQDVNSSLSRRIRTLLDALADISLSQRGNVSATMASIKDNGGTLETQLYIVFNHEDDEAAHHCRQHLESILNMLRQVPYVPPAMDGSEKVIADSLQNDSIKICRAIHNHSFDIFAHRVTKHAHRLSDIRRYIEQDQMHFEPQDRSELVEFLRHVNMILMMVANAQATNQLPATSIQMLLYMYSYWTEHDLLPKDLSVNNKPTLLDNVDTWLADKHHIDFQLRRWALKIMSLYLG